MATSRKRESAKNTREALERSLSGTHVWRRVVVVAFGSIVPTVSHSIGLCTFVPCPGTIQWKGINSLLPIDYSSGFNGFGRGRHVITVRNKKVFDSALVCWHACIHETKTETPHEAFFSAPKHCTKKLRRKGYLPRTRFIRDGTQRDVTPLFLLQYIHHTISQPSKVLTD